MTEQELQAIEARHADPIPIAWTKTAEQCFFEANADRADLLAEVRRLQGLVKQAEWAAGYEEGPESGCCPWCGADAMIGSKRDGHKRACPAFGEGK